MRTIFLLVTGVAIMQSSAGVAAQDTGRAAIFRDLVSCRSIAEASERLACYDREVARMDAAEREKGLVILDRGQLHERRRADFGLNKNDESLPAAADEPEIERLETVVESVGSSAEGGLAFTTKSGGRWVQIDDRHPFGVKAGTKVTLKKAAFGSYFADFEGTVAVRVKRVR